MKPKRVLIVDDERPARDKLRIMLGDEPDFEVVGEAGDGVNALKAIERLGPDLVFLDIQMPRLDGLAVAAHLDESAPLQVVFVTGFNEYAVKAFELNARDYLLKPFDRARLNKTLHRIRAGEAPPAHLGMNKLLRDFRGADRFPKTLMLKTDEGIRVIAIDSIDWAEASGNYVKVCLSRDVFFTRQTLTRFQSQLDPREFARIHRSHIVNLRKVKRIEAKSKGDALLELSDGTRLRLSRHYRQAFFKAFEAG